jgi:hypothetical protein
MPNKNFEMFVLQYEDVILNMARKHLAILYSNIHKGYQREQGVELYQELDDIVNAIYWHLYQK